MRGKHWLVFVAMLGWAVFGCREPNPYHCPGGSECPSPGGFCETSNQCRAPTPVCDEDNMKCVECLENGDCAVSRPICSAENTCVECEQGSACPSGLCLTDRTCADPGDVAHVDGAAPATNTECSLDMPCATVQQALALVPPRKYIKATGMITSASLINIDRKTVSIFGEPGITTITRTGGSFAPVFDIRKDSVVTLVDLEIIAGADGNVVAIREAPGPMVSMTRVKVRDARDNGILVELGAGKLVMTDSQVSNCTLAGINLVSGSLEMTDSQVLDNQQDGVKAAAGTTAVIRRSLIRGNKGTAGVFTVDAAMVAIESSIIAHNTGVSGGLSIRGPLSIKNSIISANGNIATSSVGGVTLDSTNAMFEFNTMADNIGSISGIRCVTPIFVSSSIFTGSSFDGAGCNVTYSLTGTPIPAGTGNQTGEPMFLSTSLSSPMFYRIGSMSAARDSADPAATLDYDIDGQPRTGWRDMGADEFN